MENKENKNITKNLYFKGKKKDDIEGKAKKNDSDDDKDLDFEIILRRFKKNLNMSGTLKDARRHDEFLPKSLRRKIKDEEARRRNKN